MREIKFRAWDKHEEVMIEQVGVTFSSNEDRYTKNEIYIRPNTSHYILEQYTGLKDSEGKEIYEGDILQNNGIVEYKEEEGGGIEFGAKWIGFEQDEVDDFHKDKIIGNIHEHGNLLKDVKD